MPVKDSSYFGNVSQPDEQKEGYRKKESKEGKCAARRSGRAENDHETA